MTTCVGPIRHLPTLVQLAAGTLIVAAPILLLLAIIQRQFTASFVRSGIK